MSDVEVVMLNNHSDKHIQIDYFYNFC
jgi:hypothetical protein